MNATTETGPALAEAQAALADVEQRHAEGAARWSAVEAARRAVAEADSLHRHAVAAEQAERDAAEAKRREGLRAELEVVTAVARGFDDAAAPEIARLIELDRQLAAIVEAVGEKIMAQNRAVDRARRIAKELGIVADLPAMVATVYAAGNARRAVGAAAGAERRHESHAEAWLAFNYVDTVPQ